MPAAATKSNGKPRVSGKSPAERARSMMTDSLRSEMDEIRKKVDELTEHDIDVRWDIGHHLNAIKEDKTGKYGSHPERLMKEVMPLSRDSLRPMMVLAKTYSRTDLKGLMALRHSSTQERLTWSHVIALTRIKDKAKAYAMAERAVNKGWTAKDLNKAVIGISGNPKSPGGKAPRRSTNLGEALVDVITKSKSMENVAYKAWLDEDGLAELYVAAAATWPSKKPPQAVIDQFDKAMSALEDGIVAMRQTVHQIQALASQAKAARAARQSVA